MNQATTTTEREGGRHSDESYVIAPANISGNANEYVIELEMPGVSKDGLEITVEDNELTVIGRRTATPPPGELCYCESGFSDYRRVFEIGPDINPAGIRAEMNSGVLRLILPKSERAKPRTIPVTG